MSAHEFSEIAGGIASLVLAAAVVVFAVLLVLRFLADRRRDRTSRIDAAEEAREAEDDLPIGRDL